MLVGTHTLVYNTTCAVCLSVCHSTITDIPNHVYSATVISLFSCSGLLLNWSTSRLLQYTSNDNSISCDL